MLFTEREDPAAEIGDDVLPVAGLVIAIVPTDIEAGADRRGQEAVKDVVPEVGIKIGKAGKNPVSLRKLYLLWTSCSITFLTLRATKLLEFHRLEKYLTMEGFLEKFLKIKSVLKSTGESP